MTFRPSGYAPEWDSRLRSGEGNAFDMVRLVLATLVVLEHSYFLIDNSAARDPIALLSGGRTNSGQFAVYMFFALSGFLVTQSMMNSRSVVDYLSRRVARIVPGFLVATAIGCVVFAPLAASDVGAYFHQQDWRNIVATTLALKQASVYGAFQSNPLQLVHGTLWTIRYEFDCYLFIALLSVAGLLRAQTTAVAVLLVIAILVAMKLFPPPVIDHGSAALLISSPNRWPDLFPFFFAGSAIFLFRDRIAKSKLWFFCALAGIAASFTWGGVWWSLLVAGTYATLFVALSFAAEIRVFGRRTDLSYGVYLYGWPIQQSLLYWTGMKLSALQLFATAMPFSLFVAWLIWTLVERPALALVRERRGV